MELAKPMSNKNRFEKKPAAEEGEKNSTSKATFSDETVQNAAPFIGWSSFDHFWSSCVKNGTPVIKNACIVHLKAIKAWDDQSKWIKAVQHFGIPVEK